MSVDATHVLAEGPWRHRFVAANGARFHVAEIGDGPLVLLLHGFAQNWWCWRAQLPALAHAGYRVAAMDLRGYGASDKPPRGYDTPTLAADVAAVVRSLGEPAAAIVGHDIGAWIAWSMPALEPAVTRGVAALSMPHPLRLRAALLTSRAQRRASRYVWAFQQPVLPERRLVQPGTIERLQRAWGAPGRPLDEEAVEWYSQAIAIPFVAHCALEYFRWIVRSQVRGDGRAFAEAIDRPIAVPVLQLQGASDPCILPATARGCRRWVTGQLRYEQIEGGGHFLPEERADEVSAHLLRWLAQLG